jgi:uncharacterized membrane protein YphA (DoxX/SURF4 family)
MKIKNIDKKLITWFGRTYVPAARLAVFIVYFWFGFLKIIDQSPASPLASALVSKTVGLAHFRSLFIVLGLFECLIGLLFLIPKATRLVIPMLLTHLLIVCSPLFIIPHLVWSKPLVPTLEGQYIIKNVAIIALAIGIAAHATPIGKSRK